MDERDISVIAHHDILWVPSVVIELTRFCQSFSCHQQNTYIATKNRAIPMTVLIWWAVSSFIIGPYTSSRRIPLMMTRMTRMNQMPTICLWTFFIGSPLCFLLLDLDSNINTYLIKTYLTKEAQSYLFATSRSATNTRVSGSPEKWQFTENKFFLRE